MTSVCNSFLLWIFSFVAGTLSLIAWLHWPIPTSTESWILPKISDHQCLNLGSKGYAWHLFLCDWGPCCKWYPRWALFAYFCQVISKFFLIFIWRHSWLNYLKTQTFKRQLPSIVVREGTKLQLNVVKLRKHFNPTGFSDVNSRWVVGYLSLLGN